MIHFILDYLKQIFSPANVFYYITFRTIFGFVVSFILTALITPILVKFARERSLIQGIREYVPEGHLAKSNIPSVGGFVILSVSLLLTLLLSKLDNILVWLYIFCVLSFGFIGALDDLRKFKTRSYDGLTEKQKLLLQFLVSLVLVSVLLILGHKTAIHIPFSKDWLLELGYFGYLLFGCFVVVGSSNATNLTDGLDGLAVGNIIIILGVLIVFCYLAGTLPVSKYLGIFFVHGVAELSVSLGILAGACLGFLWHNCYPASSFMGDTGALAIGAALGFVSLLCKQELPFAIASGILIIEALSVLIQRYYFKLTKGKRFFRMAPLHHHFELLGWSEPKIIIRFWIISVICAVIALSTLKIR